MKIGRGESGVYGGLPFRNGGEIERRAMKSKIIRSVDSQGRTVEEIHHPDGTIEIVTYMGHAIENHLMREELRNIVWAVFPFILGITGYLIGKFM